MSSLAGVIVRLSPFAHTPSRPRPSLPPCSADPLPQSSPSLTSNNLIEIASSRRFALIWTALAAATAPSLPADAANERVTSGLDKYVRRKKLDRIELYVPPLLNARDQLIRVGRVMLQDAKGAREMLRSGAFSGIRQSVRALGEYAAEHGAGKDGGGKLVTEFFQELEALDFELFQAVREDTQLGEGATRHLHGTIVSLDRLLAVVPTQAMEQANAVIDSLKNEEEETLSVEQGSTASGMPDDDNAELRRLQRLL